MTVSIYWFRNDLRLTDNVALAAACSASDELLLIHVRSPDENMATPWGFARRGPHRQRFRDQALAHIRASPRAIRVHQYRPRKSQANVQADAAWEERA